MRSADKARWKRKPPDHVELKVSGGFNAARLLSPDSAARFEKAPSFGGSAAELLIPKLSIYSVVVLDRK